MNTNIRGVALPVEHGGWGVLLESLLLGLLLTPSWPGALFGLAMLMGWLLRQPLRLWIREKGRESNRSRAAQTVCVLYAGGMLAAGIAVWLQASMGTRVLIGASALMALAVLWADLRNQQRQEFWELAGAFTLASSVAVLLACGGRPLQQALLVYVLVALRHASSIVFVRNRLRAARGKPYRPRQTGGIYIAGSTGLALLAYGNVVSPWILSAFLVMGLYAWISFHEPHARIQPKRLGWHQVVLGVIFCASILIGYQ